MADPHSFQQQTLYVHRYVMETTGVTEILPIGAKDTLDKTIIAFKSLPGAGSISLSDFEYFSKCHAVLLMPVFEFHSLQQTN